MSDPNRAAEKAAKQEAVKQRYISETAGLHFQEWPKIGRLNRDIVITEKLDGTNAAIGIQPMVDQDQSDPIFSIMPGVVEVGGSWYRVYAQSRSRVITPETDNMGFASWVRKHAADLAQFLGEGLHHGEWWGVGIQRGYGLSERRFSLFNTERWTTTEGLLALSILQARGVAVHHVPVLYKGPWTGMFGFTDNTADGAEKPWLRRDQMSDWPEVQAVYAEAEERINDIMGLFAVSPADAEIAWPSLREKLWNLVRVNPRPRFAPNFILEFLKRVGSQAAPGYMNPEGIVVFHKASGTCFKATVEKDEQHKFENPEVTGDLG